MKQPTKETFEIAEENAEVRTSGFGFRISSVGFMIILTSGLVVILILGLVSGLTIRPNKCIKNEVLPTTFTTKTSPTISITTATGMKNFSIILAKFASLEAKLSFKEIYGSVINVTLIEDAAKSYFESKYKAFNFESIWQPYSPYFMTIKFTFSSSQSYLLETIINDFFNNAFNLIFSPDNLPTGYSVLKTDFNSVLYESKCDACIPVATQTSNIKTTTKAQNLTDRVRLPDYVIPTNYDLRLNAYFQPETTKPDDSVTTNYYTGHVMITFDLKKQTKSIIFHADSNLKIDSIKLWDNIYHISGEVALASNYLERLDYQLVRLNLANEIAIGGYKLEIEFSSNYGPSSNLVGFYRTKYVQNGITYSVLGSKFQPTYARNAYPCFDEPALKASFSITLEHPQRTIALSNWPQKSNKTIGVDRIETTFETTSKMSTYLAAWAILPLDFDYKEAKSSEGKPIRVYARKQVINSGLIDFAVDVAKKSTDYFHNVYFDSSLQALPPKIDMIGFPDFASGAMEHWGIIGYRESNLFYLDNKNPLSSKQSVAFVIAHELSHFWFGNLVTCKWWNDLWLNEAMARFLQFKAINNIFPEWNVYDQFITLYQLGVMFDDGFPSSSHPVSAEVLTPNEINTLFDSITYDKGSSLLRMLESTVSEENFRTGLNNYLKSNQFSASEAADFYNLLKLPQIMLDQGVTPQQYMENWLLQINYPKISVDLINSNGKTRVNLKQSRFNFNTKNTNVNEGISSPFGYKWIIYLRCAAGNSQGTQTYDFEAFLNKNDAFVDLDKTYDWVKCNKDFRGFYLNEYSVDSFKSTINAIKQNPNIFTIGDQANLVHNTFAQAYVPENSYEMAGYLTSYLSSAPMSYVPWRVFTWHMNKLASILEHKASFVNLRKFGQTLVNGLDKIDIWNDNGDHTVRLLKATLFDFLCRIQDEKCLKSVTNLFKNLNQSFFNDPNNIENNISPNIRGPVYKYHIQNTNDYQEWFKLGRVYELTVDPQERTLVMDAIGQSRINWILDSICLECLWKTSNNTNKIDIRPQDYFTMLTYIGRNPNGRHFAWAFIRHYWDELVKKFGLTNRSFANALRSVCETFETEFLLEEMESFFRLHEAGTGSLQRSQALDIVLNNINWLEKNKEEDLNRNLFSIWN